MTLLEFDRNRFCELVEHSPHLSLTIARLYAQKLRTAKTNAYPPIEIWLAATAQTAAVLTTKTALTM